MIGIIEVIVSFGLVILFDTRRLKTAGKLKVIIIYSVLMLVSFIVSILLVTGNRPVSPSDLIKTFLQSLGVVK